MKNPAQRILLPAFILISIFSSTAMAAAVLNCNLSLVPQGVSVGQSMTLIMTVTNVGTDAASGVTPQNPIQSGTGLTTYLSGPMPFSITISAGASGNFTWLYVAAAAGCISFSSNAGGIDFSSGLTITSAACGSGTVCIESPANLVCELSAYPSQVSVGQDITVIMSVSNTGGADALAVMTSFPLVKIGTGTASYVSVPVPATIAGGGAAYFTWVFSATGAGTIGWNGSASGTDENSGLTVSSGACTTNMVTIQTPASLACGISANPQKINIGQMLTVRMIVTNTGGADAISVTPGDLTVIGVGGTNTTTAISQIGGPAPAGLQTIPGGSYIVFTWTYSASGAGTVYFSGSSSGNDTNSGMPISCGQNDSNNVIIQTPASLFCGLNVMPSQASIGQYITLVMSVTNTGRADAINVCPSFPGVMGTGGVTMLSAPACVTITGLSVAHFTWTYSAAAVGNVQFTASAQGADVNSGMAVMTNTCMSNNVTIQTPASLTAALITMPKNASLGQTITVVMSVTNTGEATAANVAVTPGNLSKIGTGGVIQVTGPAPLAMNITGGSSGYFTWTFSAIGIGTLCFSGLAAGTDINSGLPVSSAPALDCISITPMLAKLEIGCLSSPGAVSVGQAVTVIINVSNTGADNADNVSASLTVLGDAAGLSYLAGPVPVNAYISAGTATQFTWLYNCTSPGSVSFYAEASGTDVVWGVTVNADPVTCGPIIMQAQAALSCGISVSPGPAVVGQQVTVLMIVTNTGQATADNVIPVYNVYGSVIYVQMTAPGPGLAIPGGTSVSFAWIYQVLSTGTLCVSGTAQGADANSGAAVSSGGCGNCINVMPNFPVLTSWISVSPNVICENQRYTVVMSVSNIGAVAAPNTVPGALSGTIGTIVSGPQPANASIPAGSYQEFTWVYQAPAGNAGPSCISGLAATGAQMSIDISCCNNNCIESRADPVLSQDIWLYPSSVCVGQEFTVRMNVSNSGGSTAYGVVPSSLLKFGTGNYAYVSGPMPVSRTISALSNGYFTWVYVATAAGTMGVNLYATGYSPCGTTVTSAPTSSNFINIQSSAVLICSLSAFPDPVLVGGNITVVMTVTNYGSANADNVIVYELNDQQVAGGGASLIMGSLPTAPVTITGGSYANFTWVYSADSAGTIAFTGRAQGEHCGGMPASSSVCTSNNVVISAGTLTDTPTPTVTPTQTSCVGDGSVSISPSFFTAGSCGNTIQIIYTAGPTGWAASPGYGTFKITFPAGWSAPSWINTLAPGYYTVDSIGGTLTGSGASGQDILVFVEGLPANTGQIIITYGDKSLGGPGACVPAGAGAMCFEVEMDADGSATCPVLPQFCINVATPTCTPTVNVSPSFTATDTMTPAATSTAAVSTPTNTPEAVPPLCFITKWGSTGSGNGNLAGPGGIATDSFGYVYVADMDNDRIQKFDADGNYITQWGTYGTMSGQFRDPRMIAVDSTGNVFVSDYGNNRIQKFDANGNYITQWGTLGGGNGQFNGNYGIAAGAGGNIYVVDRYNNRVQVFDNNGTYLFQWGSGGSGNGLFSWPTGITLDPTGNVYISDFYNNLVQKFDGSGNFITQWGGSGSGAGQFNYPSSAAISAAGIVYVMDENNNRIQVFSSSGVYIEQWGSLGAGDGQFFAPVDGVFGPGGYLYVTDWGNDRIQKFGPCGTPTVTATASNTVTTVGTATVTDTVCCGTETVTPTITGTATATVTITGTLTLTLTETSTHTPSDTPTATETACCLSTATYTQSPTRSATETLTGTPYITLTPSMTHTWTQTWPVCCATSTFTPTNTPTPPQNTTLLSISKTAGGEPPAVGARITYEIEIRNNDVNPAFNLTVWDTLPAQVKFLYNNSGVPYVINGQYIVWDLSAEPAASPLNPGGVIYITFLCEITGLADGAPIANYAGCDYDDASGGHAPVFSQLVFYPADMPAVYPNPATDYVKFTNVVPGSQVEIYTLSGEYVNSIDVQQTIVTWECKNRFNSRVSPGIYYYIIKDSGKKMRYRGKIFVVNP